MCTFVGTAFICIYVVFFGWEIIAISAVMEPDEDLDVAINRVKTYKTGVCN